MYDMASHSHSDLKTSAASRPSALRVDAVRRNETWGSHTHTVWWTQTVKEEEAITFPGLMTIDANQVFRPGSVFFGFGLPNVYMALVGDNKTAKVDAKSLYRDATKITENNGRVQSGFFIVPRDLSHDAVTAVVRAAHEAQGCRNITCVLTNTQILSSAGFTINGKCPLTTWPSDLLRNLLTGVVCHKRRSAHHASLLARFHSTHG